MKRKDMMENNYLDNVANSPFTSVGNWSGASPDSLWPAVPSISVGTHQGVATRKPWVMVIDDSPTVRKIVETWLRREGIEVRSFSDGVKAMAWLIEPGAGIPKLIILDIELPMIDGYEIARRIKAKPQFRQTVIIILSCRDGMLDRVKGRLAGVK